MDFIPGSSKRFYSSSSIQNGSGVYTTSYSTGTGGSYFWGKRSQGMKVITYFHLVLRLGMSEAIIALPYIPLWHSA
jgi:hypothetical protein